MPLLTRRRQILANINATDAFQAGTIAAGKVIQLLSELQVGYDVPTIQRNALRPQIGQLEALKGTRMATINFKAELAGSGTPGSPPPIGPLLRGCGFLQTINSGSAAVATAIPMAGNVGLTTGDVAPAVPAVTGTYGGTKSGILQILITAVTATTSIVFQATFFPADGTARTSANFTQNSSSAVSITSVASGLSVDFGDPSASTDGYVVGDAWTSKLTSSSQVDVEYTLRDSGFEYLDLATIRDGNLDKFFGAMGTVAFSGKLNEFPSAAFQFKAIPAGFDAQAFFASGVPTAATPPPFLGIDATLDAADLQCLVNFGIDIANNVVMQQCAQATYGFEQARITSRAPKLTIDPEAVAYATRNPYAALFGDDTEEVIITIGSVAGNIITFTAPLASTVGASEGNREDYMTDEIEYQLSQPATDPGDGFSEIKIKFS